MERRLERSPSKYLRDIDPVERDKLVSENRFFLVTIDEFGYRIEGWHKGFPSAKKAITDLATSDSKMERVRVEEKLWSIQRRKRDKDTSIDLPKSLYDAVIKTG